MLITDGYRQQNAAMHTKGNYGISSAKWAVTVKSLMDQFGVETLLDYGSGQGLLKRELMILGCTAHVIREYDPAIPGLDMKPEPADMVACTDVLEHIEPECLGEVISDIARLTKKVALLVVATKLAAKNLPDGRNAHLIVNPAWWWLRELHYRWRIYGMHEDAGQFSCICVPR